MPASLISPEKGEKCLPAKWNATLCMLSMCRHALSSNHELAYCAPTCSKKNRCPELLRDPRSGKTLQATPTCTADLGDTPDDFVGHCYLSRFLRGDGSMNYNECDKYTDPQEKSNCISHCLLYLALKYRADFNLFTLTFRKVQTCWVKSGLRKLMGKQAFT